MSQERRGEPRTSIGKLGLVAHDNLADRMLGSVTNLSHHGLTLLSNHPVDNGGTLQLDLRRASSPDQSLLEIAISITWTRPADTPDNLWLGAQIIGISNAHAQKLDDLIKQAENNH